MVQTYNVLEFADSFVAAGFPDDEGGEEDYTGHEGDGDGQRKHDNGVGSFAFGADLDAFVGLRVDGGAEFGSDVDAIEAEAWRIGPF